MPSPFAEPFIDALRHAEETGDLNPLVDLFTEDAELSNLAGPQPGQGKEAARLFWHTYLSVFSRVRSKFTHVTEGDGAVVLEWLSEATTHDGTDVAYRGVSVLETEPAGIRQFRTYYDSAALRTPAVAKA